MLEAIMSKTQQAIQKHGAKAVYQAATAHMAGDKANGLTKVGLVANTMGEVFAIQTEAYKQMGPADQAIDAADATAALEVIRKRGRPFSKPGHEAPTKPRSIRLDDDRWAKLQALGREWLERQIDRAKI
jgi:uncharacterized protein (DUF4415 family)